jgi:hypothetical protein
MLKDPSQSRAPPAGGNALRQAGWLARISLMAMMGLLAPLAAGSWHEPVMNQPAFAQSTIGGTRMGAPTMRGAPRAGIPINPGTVGTPGGVFNPGTAGTPGGFINPGIATGPGGAGSPGVVGSPSGLGNPGNAGDPNGLGNPNGIRGPALGMPGTIASPPGSVGSPGHPSGMSSPGGVGGPADMGPGIGAGSGIGTGPTSGQ